MISLLGLIHLPTRFSNRSGPNHPSLRILEHSLVGGDEVDGDQGGSHFGHFIGYLEDAVGLPPTPGGIQGSIIPSWAKEPLEAGGSHWLWSDYCHQ